MTQYSPAPGSLDHDQIDTIAEHTFKGMKIEAVKAVKRMMGLSLYESKSIIDHVAAKVGISYGYNPTPATRKAWVDMLTRDFGPGTVPDPADALAELIANKILAKLANAITASLRP